MAPDNERNSRRATWEMLDRYLAGAASPHEQDLIRRSLHGQAQIVERLHDPSLYRGGSVSAQQAVHQPSWAAMQARIESDASVAVPSDSLPGSHHQPSSASPNSFAHSKPASPLAQHGGFVRTAVQPLRHRQRNVLAVCGVVIGIGLFALVTGRKWERTHLAATLASQTFTYTTGPGRQATIRLPDGTSVLLNVASQLDVPANFSVGNRVVTLQGEAFFDVEHQTTSPFIVEAGESHTTVLGTRFSVRRYPSDSAAIVAVDDGKVSVNKAILTAQQQIVVSQGHTSAVTQVTPERFSFIQGTMMLDRVVLRDAVRDLDRWYGAEIRIADPALESRVLTLVAGDGSLADLASILELTLGVRVERNGHILTLFQR